MHLTKVLSSETFLISDLCSVIVFECVWFRSCRLEALNRICLCCSSSLELFQSSSADACLSFHVSHLNFSEGRYCRLLARTRRHPRRSLFSVMKMKKREVPVDRSMVSCQNTLSAVKFKSYLSPVDFHYSQALEIRICCCLVGGLSLFSMIQCLCDRHSTFAHAAD